MADNLRRLFESEGVITFDAYRAAVEEFRRMESYPPSRQTAEEYESGLRDQFKNNFNRYRRDLENILSGLNEEAGAAHSLSGALRSRWLGISLKESAENHVAEMPYVISQEDVAYAYASGHQNAATLYLGPARPARERGDTINMGTTNWKISDDPIRAQRRMLVSGKLVPDPVSALELYLQKLEERIVADIVALKGDAVVPEWFFQGAPCAGLSLVGFGDALQKIAQDDTSRGGEYVKLARNAYETSGLGNTGYVEERLLQTGILPPNTHVLVPVEKLPPDLLRELGYN